MKNEQNESGFFSLLADLLFFAIKAAVIVFICGFTGMLLAESLLNQ